MFGNWPEEKQKKVSLKKRLLFFHYTFLSGDSCSICDTKKPPTNPLEKLKRNKN